MLRELLATDLGFWVFIVGMIALFAVSVEGGFRIGRRARAGEERKSQAGTVLGAMLALLGFLLAISFSIAENRFAQRKALVLEEANAIGTAALRADFLPPEQTEKAERWFEKYIQLRLDLARQEIPLETALARSQTLQHRLWEAAETAAERHPRSVPLGLFVDSLNEVIDLQQERVTVGVHFRLPPSLLWLLLLVAELSMLTLGYYFGLGGERSWPTAAAVVLAFAAVIVLIVDLDQVNQRLFSVTQEPLIDTLQSIEASLGDEE